MFRKNIHYGVYILILYTLSLYYFFIKSKSFNLIGWSWINISYENLIILYELGVKKEENFRGIINEKNVKDYGNAPRYCYRYLCSRLC
jgi:hypothetical protein